jgi:hypothetical protein
VALGIARNRPCHQQCRCQDPGNAPPLLLPLLWSSAPVVHSATTASIATIVAEHPVDWLCPAAIAPVDPIIAVFLKEQEMPMQEPGIAMNAIMVILVIFSCQGPPLSAVIANSMAMLHPSW